ncbi:MAG: hypothetical protein ACYC6P_12745 [Ignavibacteriaceae bacterium]
MPKEDKIKLAIELIKFFLYLVTLIISIAFAFNSMDKRISIIESEMKYKVNTTLLLEKLDQVKDDINKKIESEISRVSVPPLSGKVKK